MSNKFKTRVFGGSIDQKVRKKLSTRQEVSDGKVAINDPVSKEILGLDSLTAGTIGSSQTPVVRMYTVLERVPILSTQTKNKLISQSTVGEDVDTEKLRFLVQQEERKSPTAKHVYMIGDYKGASLKINAPMTGEDKDRFYRNQQNNDFLKQEAGITSLSIKTEGELGSLVTSVIEFKVNNFHDFENIYSKHFLKPGALIIIDAGWNTGTLYDPKKLIDDNQIEGILGPKSLIDFLHKDDGIVENSNGDMLVNAGRVMDYSSKIATDGTIDCSITISSANRGLIDQNLDAEDLDRAKLSSRLSSLIIFSMLKSVGLTLVSLNDIVSDKSTQQLEEDKELLTITFNTGDIPKDQAVKQGIFYHPDCGFYISIGKLEDAILNESFSISKKIKENVTNQQRIIETKFGAEGTFDSSESFMYISQLLKDYALAATRTGRSPIIIFPENYDVSYNSLYSKIPEEHTNVKNRSERDRLQLKIPVREVFINVETVQKAFTTEKFRVSEALQSILDDINSEYSIYNLDLHSPTKTDEHLSIVDRDLNDVRNSKEKEFIFKPFSKSSQVIDVDLSYQMPKGGIQSMIAIQNSSLNEPIEIISSQNQSAAHLRRLVINKDDKYFNKTYQSIALKNTDVNVTARMKNDKFTEEQIMTKQHALRKTKGLDKAYYDKIIKNTLNTQETVQESSIIGTPLPPKKVVTKVKSNANTVREGYELARRRMLGEKELKAPLLPFSLSLTIFGTGGIFPGDFVSVDYLPKQIKNEATFLVTSVEHKFDQSWSTTLSTEMKLKDIKPTKYVPITVPPKPKPKIEPDQVVEIESIPVEKPKKEEKPEPAPKRTESVSGRPNPTKTFGIPSVVDVPAEAVRSWVQGGDKGFGTFYDMMLDFATQYYCSTDFIRRQAIKKYKRLVTNTGIYTEPVFSATREVQTILNQNGYYQRAFGEMFAGSENHMLNIADSKKYFKGNADFVLEIDRIMNIQASMIHIEPGGRVYEYVAKPGLQPMGMWLKPNVKPPEPYLGYPGPLTGTPESELNALGWNSNVFGTWKSDQNGHILDTFPELRGPSSARFSKLEQLNTQDPDFLFLRFRQTQRGSFPDSFETNIRQLIEHFEAWKNIWFSAAVERKVTQLEAKNKPKKKRKPPGAEYQVRAGSQGRQY